ncbi:MAG: DUF4412 domain-containing protein [Bacteroidales bacterium]|nr:DUF4412 domain-containing protein [Bacteroidales bacterium]
MKRSLIYLILLLWAGTAYGQHILTYQSYAKGVAEQDTTTIQVIENAKCLKIRTEEKKLSNPVPGYAQSNTYVDYVHDSVYTILDYADGKYYSSYSLTDNDVVFNKEGKEKLLGYDCTKYTTSINSNAIEVWMTEGLGFEATPMPGLGRLQGVMVRCMRNGSYITDLDEVKEQKYALLDLIPDNKGLHKSSRELAQLRKDKLVMRIPVFEDAQIHFAEYEPVIGDIPFDTTLHFSHGTLIVKRMRLPELPAHYQIFAEIHQRSNGDAYDRTASVFVIPTEKAKSFKDGMQRLEALPSFVGKDGKEYQGIKAEKDYLPPVELVRFFTSFGAGHFNDRVQIDGLEWADENYYKMEVSELRDRLRGDVLIGAFIGNYDNGGHKLSLDLLAYPGENKWSDKPLKEHSIPLFNTCNVMEMSGQNYGRLFATDSLEVEFEIPNGAKNVRLLYISTGHGGWDNGDEFNPKENAIYIDGVKQFTHTPWRCDCATFRDQSPVSGNFWNGVSSSDYSRSGWCPGTATNPVYFDLSGLKPGKHTLRVAIPQGKDEGESFSHWMVSGVLLYDDK